MHATTLPGPIAAGVRPRNCTRRRPERAHVAPWNPVGSGPHAGGGGPDR